MQILGKFGFGFWLLCSQMALLAHDDLASEPNPRGNLQFQNFTVKEGLSNNSVYDMVQDQQGFLWIATSDGLNRYDGYRFLVYRHDPEDPATIIDNRLRDLFLDRQGRIWIGSDEAGLSCYDPGLDQFTNYQHDPNDSRSLPSDSVFSMVQDGNGRIWIGTEDGLACLIDNGSGFRTFRGTAGDGSGFESSHIRALFSDSRGRLWVGSDSGLFLMDTGSLSFIKKGPPMSQVSLEHDRVFSIIEVEGLLWVGTSNGAYSFDPESGSARRYLASGQDQSLSHPFVYSLLDDEQGGIWMGTFGGGLNRLNRTTDRIDVYQNDPVLEKSLVGNRIRSLFRDRSGMVWIGTASDGLSKLNPNCENFHHFTYHPLNKNSLASKQVSAIIEDIDSNNIWIGSVSRGLNRMDRSRGIFKHYQNEPKNPNSLPGSGVFTLFIDQQEELWLGSNNGLARYRRNTDDFVTFRREDDSDSALVSNDIWSIAQDPTQPEYLWVGTWDNGFSHVNRETGKGTGYRHRPSNPDGLSHPSVVSILANRDGTLWLGTFGGGLNHFDPSTGKFRVFRHRPGEPGLSQDIVGFIFRDRRQILWLGTEGGGLNRFDPNTETFRVFRMADGLPSDAIQCIAEDDKGYLWIGTNNGLCKFDPLTETIRHFTTLDGAQDTLFGRAAEKTRAGEMLFGGSDGFNIFLPEKISDNLVPPELVVTDLFINNQSLKNNPEFEVPVSRTNNIYLHHQDYVFSIEIAALHFADPARNRYAYMLEGLDKDWVRAGSDNRRVTYTSLDPGNYRFLAKAANKDGIWSTENLVINIKVLPAPWLTWWAKILYAAAIAWILYLIERARMRRKHRLEEKNKELAAMNDDMNTLEDMIRVINRDTSLQDVLKTLLNQGLRLFPQAQQGGFLLWDPNIKKYRILATVGYEKDMSRVVFTREELLDRYTRNSIPLGQGIFLVNKPGRAARADKFPNDNPVCLLAMAMTFRGELEGFVVWDNNSRENAFDKADAVRLERFREHAVSAVAKAHYLQVLQKKNEEIVRTRDQLILQEKMASLGTLTAGIAHEIRNPLNFVNNFAIITAERFVELREELERRREEMDPEFYLELEEVLRDLAQNLELISNHGMKADNIIKSMMQLATGQASERRATNINHLVREFTNLACQSYQNKQKDFHPNVALDLDPNLAMIEGEGGSLSRVLINLVTNALEAMATRLEHSRDSFSPRLEIMTRDLEDSMAIHIRDNGVGIAPADIDQIFNPFFTTKSPEKGNIGLGLSISYDIVVHEHQGELKVNSDHGNTEFIISLPKTGAAHLIY